ncbi:hypothetical protein RRG08_029350 [Elysia crispata]|uniref:Uncharacterized protein n=1 Tax=Elysia crispata TaxID=231223 RepID=A0AAE1ARX1_9GAST|nr:hypothetical protein RRG08_029350 [Elysia crispata]
MNQSCCSCDSSSVMCHGHQTFRAISGDTEINSRGEWTRLFLLMVVSIQRLDSRPQNPGAGGVRSLDTQMLPG